MIGTKAAAAAAAAKDKNINLNEFKPVSKDDFEKFAKAIADLSTKYQVMTLKPQ